MLLLTKKPVKPELMSKYQLLVGHCVAHTQISMPKVGFVFPGVVIVPSIANYHGQSKEFQS